MLAKLKFLVFKTALRLINIDNIPGYGGKVKHVCPHHILANIGLKVFVLAVLSLNRS